MSEKINFEPTAQIIEQCAKTLEDYAKELRRKANHMRQRKSFEYAGDSIQAIKNCFANLRTDLLVVRPLREYEKQNPDHLDSNRGSE